MAIPALPLSAALAALTLIVSTVKAAEETYPDLAKLLEMPRQAAPDVAEASDEGELAIQRMRLPEPLKLSLWAAEPMLANAVAFTIDERGRLFVAETYRYRTSVLDIRDFIGTMLEADLAARTIEDRIAVIDRHFGAVGSDALSIESERIRLVEDRDGDGKADFSSIYAEGFNHRLDGIASGVLAREDKVWVANIPSIWLLEGTSSEGRALRHTELSRGYGVHFNYTGHDLHGLIIGPDGKLYFSIGDRGAHVVTKEGVVIDVPDTGAVFRSDLNGDNLELFASGLRNPQELAFDEHGNLWTGDNDSDQGDLERLVYVVDGGESGWTIGYQFAPLGRAGPWNLEKLWQPRHEGQPAYLLPPIVNIEDGPSGIAYYPGTGLGDKYRGHLFMTHFKGGSARSGIHSYTFEPEGASFRIVNSAPFLQSALPTDVMFGADGRMYFSDWDEGWPKSRKGRIYTITNPETINDPLVKETETLLKAGFRERAPAELSLLLGHADQRVRTEAQFELARRADPAPLAVVARNVSAAPLARLHAIWGLGQIARTERAALTALPALLSDADPEVRAQSVKVLGEAKEGPAFDALITALKDEAVRVRFFAAQSLGKLARPEAAGPLLEVLRENADQDLYLRHAVVMGLVGSGNHAALAAAANDSDRSVRLGVLLAYRRLKDPAVAGFLDDADPLLAIEAARAINDVPIAAAQPALAARLDHVTTDEMYALRALNAHFRLGADENARALAAFAASNETPATQRAEAITHLGSWARPSDRDRLMGVYRPLGERDATVAIAALEPMLPALLMQSPEAVQLASMDAISKLGLTGAGSLIFDLVAGENHPDAVRRAALALLDTLDDPRLSEAVALAGTSASSSLRLAALPLASRLSPAASIPVIETLLAQGNQAEQRAAFNAIDTLADPRAADLITVALDRLDRGEVAAGVQLDLLEIAGKRSEEPIKQRLTLRETALAADADPLAPYRVAMQGGDRNRGIRLFREHPVLACMRCHKVAGEGGEAGPDLSVIGRERTHEQLLESIVRPNASLSPGFESVILTLTDGAVHAGTVSTEDEESITLKKADGDELTLAKTAITSRETTPSSMPDVYRDLLTKRELRDLMAYLASLRQVPEPAQPRALATRD